MARRGGGGIYIYICEIYMRDIYLCFIECALEENEEREREREGEGDRKGEGEGEGEEDFD
jgi:hypothetical protein